MTISRLAPPPGPRGFAVVRFFGGGSFAGTLAYFEAVAREYGPIASFRILGRRLHLVTGPELVRTVLVSRQHAFTRANGAAILRDLLGRSMLTVDEPQHRRQRRMVQPAFHRERIASYADAMIDETLRTVEPWREGADIDISTAMTRLALAIVGRALFGSELRASLALEAALAEAMRTVSWLGPILEAVPTWANAVRLALPLPANARLARARRAMTTVIGEVIQRQATAGRDADTLLAVLVAARTSDGTRLDAQTVADELVTLLLAGHETTANALAWAWYELARQPALQARVAAEVLGATATHGRLSAALLPHLPLTANVFAEALRLYPPASAFGRRALDDCELGGYAIGAGDGILLSPYVNQRDPANFADPLRFDPDRWTTSAPPPFAYFPFGGGARLCIGEAFARMEGTLVLATIAGRYALDAHDPAPIGIAGHATLRPARAIVLRARAL